MRTRSSRRSGGRGRSPSPLSTVPEVPDDDEQLQPHDEESPAAPARSGSARGRSASPARARPIAARTTQLQRITESRIGRREHLRRKIWPEDKKDAPERTLLFVDVLFSYVAVQFAALFVMAGCSVAFHLGQGTLVQVMRHVNCLLELPSAEDKMMHPAARYRLWFSFGVNQQGSSSEPGIIHIVRVLFGGYCCCVVLHNILVDIGLHAVSSWSPYTWRHLRCSARKTIMEAHPQERTTSAQRHEHERKFVTLPALCFAVVVSTAVLRLFCLIVYGDVLLQAPLWSAFLAMAVVLGLSIGQRRGSVDYCADTGETPCGLHKFDPRRLRWTIDSSDLEQVTRCVVVLLVVLRYLLAAHASWTGSESHHVALDLVRGVCASALLFFVLGFISLPRSIRDALDVVLICSEQKDNSHHWFFVPAVKVGYVAAQLAAPLTSYALGQSAFRIYTSTFSVMLMMPVALTGFNMMMAAWTKTVGVFFDAVQRGESFADLAWKFAWPAAVSFILTMTIAPPEMVSNLVPFLATSAFKGIGVTGCVLWVLFNMIFGFLHPLQKRRWSKVKERVHEIGIISRLTSAVFTAPNREDSFSVGYQQLSAKSQARRQDAEKDRNLHIAEHIFSWVFSSCILTYAVLVVFTGCLGYYFGDPLTAGFEINTFNVSLKQSVSTLYLTTKNGILQWEDNTKGKQIDGGIQWWWSPSPKSYTGVDRSWQQNSKAFSQKLEAAYQNQTIAPTFRTLTDPKNHHSKPKYVVLNFTATSPTDHLWSSTNIGQGFEAKQVSGRETAACKEFVDEKGGEEGLKCEAKGCPIHLFWRENATNIRTEWQQKGAEWNQSKSNKYTMARANVEIDGNLLSDGSGCCFKNGRKGSRPKSEMEHGYGVCRRRWGRTTKEFNVIDFALLSQLAYLDSSADHFDRLLTRLFREGKQPTVISKDKSSAMCHAGSAHRVTMSVFKFEKQSTIVIAVRGTASLVDAIQDVNAWVESFLFGIFEHMFILLRWIPNELVTNLVQNVDRLSRQFEFNYLDVAEHDYWVSVKDKINQTRAENPGYEVILTGHSLGGGVSAIVAGDKSTDCAVPPCGVDAIAFSPPGTGTSSKKFKMSREEAAEHLTIIRPTHDPVAASVDSQFGLVQDTICQAGSVLRCHLLTLTIADLVARCGDPDDRFLAAAVNSETRDEDRQNMKAYERKLRNRLVWNVGGQRLRNLFAYVPFVQLGPCEEQPMHGIAGEERGWEKLFGVALAATVAWIVYGSATRFSDVGSAQSAETLRNFAQRLSSFLRTWMPSSNLCIIISLSMMCFGPVFIETVLNAGAESGPDGTRGLKGATKTHICGIILHGLLWIRVMGGDL